MKFLSLLLALILCLTGCAEPPAAEVTIPTETSVPAAESEPEESSVPTEPAPQDTHFTLTFTGDCTLGANPSNTYAEVGFIRVVGEDYGHPFRNVLSYFESDDATFINLEGALTDSGYPADKTYTFRGPTSYIRILTENSVDVVTLANNHSLDYGQTGYTSTQTVLDQANIPYVQRDTGSLIHLDCGLTIGMYGMVYYRLDKQDMTEEIAALRQQGADLVIVAPHWGVEGCYRPTPEQVEIGHAAIDAGADIVWGSHPHVLQPVEEYGGGVIFYSLGNFSFGGNSCPEDFDTAIVQQEIIRSPEGSITLGNRKLIPCSISSAEQINNYQPTPMAVSTPEYDRVIRKLSGTFEGADLKIRKIGK